MTAWFQNMKPRERQLFLATAIVVLGFAAYQANSSGDAVVEATETVDLATLEREYESMVSELRQAGDVLEDYRRLADRLPQPAASESVDLAFTNQLADLCEQSGFSRPRIEPARIERIDGVTEYELVSANMTTEGTFDETVRLLGVLEDNGLIFGAIDLRAEPDRDRIRASVNVSRLVPVPKKAARGRRGRS
jgi:hypothetical protein